jgi:preprotein translocase SecE subunit
VAKTRAQRKAERRAREAQQQRQAKRADGTETAARRESEAQHDTQVPVSGDVAEVTAVEVGMGAEAPESELETPDAPKAPAPARRSRAERRAEEKRRKEQERRASEEQKRRERERLARREKQATEERKRGAVIGFLVSCWAELKRVQWPNRETLVQASAVTIVFVAIAAAYLGALDAAFNWMIKQIL